MTDRPILFSAPMVRALLAGTKTQTRRLLSRGNTLFDGRSWDQKVTDDDLDFAAAWIDQGPSPAGNPGPYLKAHWNYGKIYHPPSDEKLVARLYPRIQPGARLWVKETWRTWKDLDRIKPTALPRNCPPSPIFYEADRDNCDRHGKTRVSIHMPRWASRLTLIVTDVRIERLQDISEADAKAEGLQRRMDWLPQYRGSDTLPWRSEFPCDAFHDLWNSINGADAWEKNPWVVALTFDVEQRNIDA